MRNVYIYVNFYVPLKTKGRQFDNIVVTGGTVSCHNDNLWCHQWRQNCQIEDSLFSVFWKYSSAYVPYVCDDCKVMLIFLCPLLWIPVSLIIKACKLDWIESLFWWRCHNAVHSSEIDMQVSIYVLETLSALMALCEGNPPGDALWGESIGWPRASNSGL